MKKPISRDLKNGMRAIAVPTNGSASMTIMVFVRVGSRYETKDINGASHFIEHLMFKGTKRRPDTLMISKELDRYGAEYNAFTSKDVLGEHWSTARRCGRRTGRRRRTCTSRPARSCTSG